MTLPDTYSVARSVPYLLGYGPRTETAPVRHGATGALVAPDSGTLTLLRPDGTEALSSAAVSVVGGVAQRALDLATTEAAGVGWTMIWTLTYGSDDLTIRAEAILSEYPLICPINVQDLYHRESELRHRVPQGQSDRGDGTGWQPQIDEVWYRHIQRLIDDGTEIHRIRGTTGQRELVLCEALELCTRTISTQAEDLWWRKAEGYRYQARDARGSFRIQFDTDDPGRRRSGSPTERLAPVGRPRW